MRWAKVKVTHLHADRIHLRWQKSKSHAYTLIAYTCGGQKSKAHTYTLIAYTCGGQKSKSHAHMLLAYTCGGQKSKSHLDRTHLRWAEVSGMSPSTPHMHFGILEHLYRPFTALRSPNIDQNAHFSAFGAL